MSEPPASSERVFGEPVAGETYKHRYVVSAVIVDSKGLIAVMRVGDRYFLPGGGIEDGESEQQTLIREAREECARGIVIGARLGEALFYQYSPLYGGWAIHSVYYCADFGPDLGMAPEPDHTLIHMTREEAEGRLFRRSDAWAVTQALELRQNP